MLDGDSEKKVEWNCGFGWYVKRKGMRDDEHDGI